MDWQGSMVKGDGLTKLSELYDIPLTSIDEIKDEVYN